MIMSLAIVLGAAAVYSHRIKQQQARAEAEYNRREERRIKELDEFRQKEVERMRQERIAREKKAAAMAAVHARSREAAVTIQRAWWEKKERQRVVAQSEGRQEWVQQMQHSADETARQRAERLRYYGRRCVPAAAEGGDHPQDGTDDHRSVVRNAMSHSSRRARQSPSVFGRTLSSLGQLPKMLPEGRIWTTATRLIL